jgi:hypothetical protein
MATRGVYWHIYPPHQIKPELRGHLLCILAIPGSGNSPVIRDVVDPSGRDFPRFPQIKITDFVNGPHHGIVFQGVSREALYEVISLDPPIDRADVTCSGYNRQIVDNCRKFFLRNPGHPWNGVPQTASKLLCGSVRKKRHAEHGHSSPPVSPGHPAKG